MTPYEEAQQRANEIALLNLTGQMFVTISLGGEYTNAYDVEATAVAQQPTVYQLIAQVQKRLNELGATPKLKEDGIIGPATLKAILTALKPVTKA